MKYQKQFRCLLCRTDFVPKVIVHYGNSPAENGKEQEIESVKLEVCHPLCLEYEEFKLKNQIAKLKSKLDKKMERFYLVEKWAV